MITEEEIERATGVKIKGMIKSTLFSVVYKGVLDVRLVAVKLPKINPYETLSKT